MPVRMGKSTWERGQPHRAGKSTRVNIAGEGTGLGQGAKPSLFSQEYGNNLSPRGRMTRWRNCGLSHDGILFSL